MGRSLPYEGNNQLKMVDLIRKNQRQLLPDTYSKELRDLVDQMLDVDIKKRIISKHLLHALPPQQSSEEKAYLDKLLAEKGQRLGSNIYRGSVDGFMSVDFHSRCDGVAPTVSLFKIKENQHWIGGYTTV
jgi:serine/threonine protein kinase